MRPSARLAGLTAFVVGAVIVACRDTASPAADPAAPAYSFAVIGCNRVDAADTIGDPSTANVEELRRTFQEIAALPNRPKFLFFAGDLVLGYTSDTVTLERELRAWRTLYEASPLPAAGVELVAVPGNHETQNAAKIAYAAGERTWLRVMQPYIARGGNGPVAGGADKLATDQSRLSYSFDYKDAHFVTLNTDPVGADWHAPNAWVVSDLAAARTKGATHLFVVGHKPGYSYPTVATDGLSRDPAARDAFWAALTTNHVAAMFAAHNHVYWRTQPAGGPTWQVIAGNGGSKLEAALDPTIATTGSYYGFVLTTVRNDGRVVVTSYGRDVPTSGYTAPAAATTVRDSFDITTS